ncbi:MAG: nucleotide-binding protein [Candidatus Hodarchaeales archaeon]
MKQLVVISGKGGTGKTTVTAALLHLSSNKIGADTDVDAPNLHLILQPEIKKTTDFFGLNTAVIDENTCTSCGTCMEVCRFKAVIKTSSGYQIDGYSCEGCGACEYACPEKAISMIPNKAGEVFESDSRFGEVSHALLGIGQENSGKLVAEVRKQAREMREKHDREIIIIDGPPGIGCPVLAAMADTDLVLIVTESTKTAIHDLERIVEVAVQFKIPVSVCINKYTIDNDLTTSIERYCDKKGIPVAGKIPYDKTVYKAVVDGQSIIERDPEGVVSHHIRDIWKKLEKLLA